MSDNSVWEVPALEIAKNRAQYYSENHGASYSSEVDCAMADGSELMDWAANNMNWSDVESAAKQISVVPPPANYEDDWVNGHKEIVTHK